MKTSNTLYKKAEVNSVGVWSKCGVMRQKISGEMAIEIEVLPVRNDWDGWLAISRRLSGDYQDELITLSAFEEPPF